MGRFEEFARGADQRWKIWLGVRALGERKVGLAREWSYLNGGQAPNASGCL